MGLDVPWLKADLLPQTSQIQWVLGVIEECMGCTSAGGSVLDVVVEEPVVMVLEGEAVP
jgi:hypothetical protein